MGENFELGRGGGKEITLLIPSRGRIEKLLKCLSSIESATKDKEKIEAIVRLDYDDKESIEKIQEIHNFSFDIYTIVGKRFGGYTDLHFYVNEMCSLSRGNFLFLFNDDSFIETVGWEEIVCSFKGKPIILNPNTNDSSNIYNTFPIISRNIFETLGHWSLQTHNDTWIEVIGKTLGIEVYVPNLVIFHDRPDNENSSAKEDKTWEERTLGFKRSRPQFDEKKYVDLREQDIREIKTLLSFYR